MSEANKTQVGGNQEYDCFQYIITKWVERWKDKGGVEDLKKARHALDKYIEMVDK